MSHLFLALFLVLGVMIPSSFGSAQKVPGSKEVGKKLSS